MPGFVPCPNMIQCVFKGTNGPRAWANVVHYLYTGAAPGVAGLSSLAEALSTAWSANMAPLQNTESLCTEVIATDLTSQTAGQAAVPAAIAGTRAGDPLSAQCAFLINYTVDIRYRGGHPRQYLQVGVATDLETVDAWTATFVSDVSAAWEAVYAAQVTNVYGTATIASTGCISRRTGKVARIEGVFYPYVGNVGIAEVAVATIRRRVRRAGHLR